MKRWSVCLAVAAMAMGASVSARADDVQPLSIEGVFVAPEGPAFVPDSLLVRFTQNASAESKELMRVLVGGTTVKQFDLVPGLEHVRITADVLTAIDTLKLFPGVVKYAEPDYIVYRTATPNDTYFGQGLMWGLHNTGQTVNGDPGTAGADINAPEAWDVTTGLSTTVIADIDSGVNYNHPDLIANRWVNPGEIAGNGIDDDSNGYIDDVFGRDFVNNDSDPIDDNGHGTHTSGTFGAVGNNGVGVVGVNWSCKIMALKFLSASGSGPTSGALAALNYAVNKGVKVSNNSWGGGGFSQGMLDAINASAAMGHVFVAAAGNGGFDQVGDNNDSVPFYPSSYNAASIIAVAATTNEDARASFSNYGANSVDLGAPGVNILSTYQDGYAYSGGTSMACPHVTGVVALVQGQHPTWTAAQVKQQILSTVRPVASLSGITVTGGVLNAFAAVGGGPPVNTAPTVTITSPSNGATFNVGTSITFTGSATDTQDGNLTGSLSWDSSLQGSIGSGGSFTRSDLTVGTHLITASVTDSGGLPGSATVTINVVDPGPQPPAAPSNIDAARAGTGQALVTWSDNSGNETGFELERQQRVGNTWNSLPTQSLGANTTSFLDATGNGTFRWRVRAVNDEGPSAWTGYVQLKVR